MGIRGSPAVVDRLVEKLKGCIKSVFQSSIIMSYLCLQESSKWPRGSRMGPRMLKAAGHRHREDEGAQAGNRKGHQQEIQGEASQRNGGDLVIQCDTARDRRIYEFGFGFYIYLFMK